MPKDGTVARMKKMHFPALLKPVLLHLGKQGAQLGLSRVYLPSRLHTVCLFDIKLKNSTTLENDKSIHPRSGI